jgi:hypothetical protein
MDSLAANNVTQTVPKLFSAKAKLCDKSSLLKQSYANICSDLLDYKLHPSNNKQFPTLFQRKNKICLQLILPLPEYKQFYQISSSSYYSLYHFIFILYIQ